MRRVVITGAAGSVGTHLRKELLGTDCRTTLLDRKPVVDCAPTETAHTVDIADRAALERHFAGQDAVVHLAACTSDADWPEQIKQSVEGTVNVLDAARAAQVERVVYASTNHVVGLHLCAAPVGADAPLRPDSRYGVAKAFGESVGALYALKYGMRVLCIRIGNVNTRPLDRRRLGLWISPRDLCQLVTIGIEHPHLRYEVVFGISDATGRSYDNASAYRLGYVPQDAYAPYEAEILLSDPVPPPGSAAARSVAELTLGGSFSQAEFVGSAERLLEGPGAADAAGLRTSDGRR